MPPRATAVPSDTAATEPTQRDRYLQLVEPLGSTDRRRTTEVDVAVHALNRVLELGRPISVRIA